MSPMNVRNRPPASRKGSSPRSASFGAEKDEAPGSSRSRGGRARLLLCVLSGERTLHAELGGPLTLGSGPKDGLRVEDAALEPGHLLLEPVGLRGVRVSASALGVRLNDVQVSSSQLARAGDRIAVGGVEILLWAESPPPGDLGPSPLAVQEFERRLEEEVARAGWTQRPLAVLLVRAPSLGGRRAREALAVLGELVEAPAVLGRVGPEAALLLAPGLAAGECEGRLASLLVGLEGLGGAARGGWASFPADGGDATSLLAVALTRLSGVDPSLDELPLLDPVMVRLAELFDRPALRTAPVALCAQPGGEPEWVARTLHRRAGLSAGPFVRWGSEGTEATLAHAPAGTLYVPDPQGRFPGEHAALEAFGRSLGPARRWRLVAGVEVPPIPQGRQLPVYGRPFAMLPIPPLRDRPSEVLPLAEALLDGHRRAFGQPPASLSAATRGWLCAHGWPGDVRELRTAMGLAALATLGDEVPPDVLPAALARTGADRLVGSDLREALRRTEKDALLDVLGQTRWNVTETAVRLGLPRRTIVYRMARLGLRRPER